MAMRYEHTQKGGFWFYFAIALFSIVIVLFLIDAVHRQLQDSDKVAFVLVPILGAVVILMMSSLTVTINEQTIRIRFGPGVFWKTYPLADIADCRHVRNGWWWGWGIRWYVRGWLYNIDGLDAVEISFKNGKKVRIGTDEPEVLSAAIHDAIS